MGAFWQILFLNAAVLCCWSLIPGTHAHTELEYTFNEPASEDRIIWSASDPLTWDDFQGKPDHRAHGIAALTYSIIEYKYHCEGDRLLYSVEAKFNKAKSWGREEAKNEHILEHEQLHFDITELYARKLRGKLAQHQFACGEESLFEDYVNSLMDDWSHMQYKYDAETQFSMDEVMQHAWVSFIDAHLAAHANFE